MNVRNYVKTSRISVAVLSELSCCSAKNDIIVERFSYFFEVCGVCSCIHTLSWFKNLQSSLFKNLIQQFKNYFQTFSFLGRNQTLFVKWVVEFIFRFLSFIFAFFTSRCIAESKMMDNTHDCWNTFSFTVLCFQHEFSLLIILCLYRHESRSHDYSYDDHNNVNIPCYSQHGLP